MVVSGEKFSVRTKSWTIFPLPGKVCGNEEKSVLFFVFLRKSTFCLVKTNLFQAFGRGTKWPQRELMFPFFEQVIVFCTMKDSTQLLRKGGPLLGRFRPEQIIVTMF